MEVKSGPLDKRIKKIDINRDEIFQKSCLVPSFLTIKGMKKFWKY